MQAFMHLPRYSGLGAAEMMRAKIVSELQTALGLIPT